MKFLESRENAINKSSRYLFVMLSTRGYFDDIFRDLEQSTNLGPRSMGTVGTSWHHMKMDMVELDNKFEVTADLPGIQKKDVDVKIDNNILSIRAERKQEREKKEGTSLVTEKRYGSMERNIMLPETCDADSANAEFENGVLKLTFPKKETPKSGKQITIK
eukprot:NODE_1102_length_1159_cov_0.287736.p1 type:complete len:161 gc:universal NODE_1102_length_1159_cov_0.287736:665-183(-)